MTITFDPTDPCYLDEADARDEFSRTAAVCVGCRRCVDRCDVFPRLFELVDRFDDLDPGRLTPEEQDGLVAACFGCGACSHGCPDGPHAEAEDRVASDGGASDGVASDGVVDVERLMLRMAAMRLAHGHVGWRERLATRALAAPSVRRSAFARAVGVVRDRPLADRDVRAVAGKAGPRVLLVADACPGSHRGAGVDAALADLGVAVTHADVRDCGAVWLQAGDIDRFATRARSTVRTLAAALHDDPALHLVVADPVCLELLTSAYLDAIGRAGSDDEAAALVAERATDGSDLLELPAGGGRTQLPIVHVSGCHPGGGTNWSEVFAAAADQWIEIEHGCLGCGGWANRASNAASLGVRTQWLAARVRDAATGDHEGGAIVVADCGVAARELRERAGIDAVHPLVGWSRAYGIGTTATC